MILNLIGNVTERGPDGTAVLNANQDQIFINCIFRRRVNPALRSVNYACERRPGTSVSITPAAGQRGAALTSMNLGPITSNVEARISGFDAGGSTSTIYVNTTSIGTMSGYPLRFVPCEFSNTRYLAWMSTDQTGWYLSGDANATNFTGTLSSGTATVTGIASTSGLYPGQSLSGTGIAAGARISSVDSSSQITMTANATASGAQTISHSAISKIIDPDFPSAAIGSFAFLDGYLFVMNQSGRIYNSDLNSASAWSASAYITANFFGDTSSSYGSVIRYRNYVLCAKENTAEFFYNAGNATGSPLSRAEHLNFRIGLSGSALPFVILDDILYFGAISGGTFCVWRLNGFTPERISNPDVENILSSATGDFPSLEAFYWGGVPILMVVNDPAEAAGADFRKMVYQIDVGIWSEWTGTPLGRFAQSFGQNIYSLDTSGTLGHIYACQQTNPLYQDATTSIARTIRTSKLDSGSLGWKFVPEVHLMGDKQTYGQITFEKSDDDFATWQTLEPFDLTSMRPVSYRCGGFVGARAYRLTDSTSTAATVWALDIK